MCCGGETPKKGATTEIHTVPHHDGLFDPKIHYLDLTKGGLRCP